MCKNCDNLQNELDEEKEISKNLEIDLANRDDIISDLRSKLDEIYGYTKDIKDLCSY